MSDVEYAHDTVRRAFGGGTGRLIAVDMPDRYQTGDLVSNARTGELLRVVSVDADVIRVERGRGGTEVTEMAENDFLELPSYWERSQGEELL